MNVKIIFWNFCFEEDLTLHKKLKLELKKYKIKSEFALWGQKESLPNKLHDIDYLLKFQKDLELFDNFFLKKIYDENFEIYLNSIYSRGFWFEKTYFDLTFIFKLQILAIYFYMKNSKFTHGIFSPHHSQGFDFIFYQMAKKMKIKTLVFKSFFRNRIFYSESFEDWGDFKKTKTIFNTIDKNIFKMQDYHYETENLFLKKKFPIKILFINPLKILNLKYIYFKITNFKKNYSLYKFAKNEQSRPKYSEQFGDKYLYFPLHFQPEATTIGSANDYIDQAKVLELVSAKLPPNFKIIVKEHPAQVDLFHRSALFYKRIKNIKNVFFTNVNDNQDKLIKNCSALISITGTAGFEALKNEKKVITFGQAWYNSLEYVYKWNSNINFKKIFTVKFDKKKFTRSFRNLTKRMPQCVDSVDWAKAVDLTSDFKNVPFNETIEIKRIAETINSLIKKHY